MSVLRLMVAVIPLVCACGAQEPPADRFKKGGSGRLKAWEEVQPHLVDDLGSCPKTKLELANTVEKWLGKSESAAVKECEHLVVWAGSPQPMNDDVFAYLLRQEKSGFRRYLVVDFRNPAKPEIREASMTGPPSTKDTPLRLSESERTIANELDPIAINLAGGNPDGSAKPGFRIWIQDGQGSEEVLRKARSLTTLVAVDLEGKQVTDSWISHLEGHSYVGSITLRSTSVTDRGLAFLKKSTGLKWLTLKKCAITDPAVQALRASLPGCEITREP